MAQDGSTVEFSSMRIHSDITRKIGAISALGGITMVEWCNTVLREFVNKAHREAIQKAAKETAPTKVGA
jgi:hypothetical protein